MNTDQPTPRDLKDFYTAMHATQPEPAKDEWRVGDSRAWGVAWIVDIDANIPCDIQIKGKNQQEAEATAKHIVEAVNKYEVLNSLWHSPLHTLNEIRTELEQAKRLYDDRCLVVGEAICKITSLEKELAQAQASFQSEAQAFRAYRVAMDEKVKALKEWIKTHAPCSVYQQCTAKVRTCDCGLSALLGK